MYYYTPKKKTKQVALLDSVRGFKKNNNKRGKVEMKLEEELLLVTARRDVYVAAARRKHSLAASDVLNAP